MLNSLNFCLSGKFWFLHQIWGRISLGRDCLVGCRFFPFITLNMSCCSGVYSFCWESVDSLMRVPMYIICHLPFAAFNISSLSLMFVSLITMSWCVPPWVYPALDSLCFLDLVDYFLSHVSKVFSYYLFEYFLRSFLSLFSFWNPYNANIAVFNVVPKVS